MPTLTEDLSIGLKIVEPFLKQHGFEFDNFENEDADGQYTSAKYKNKHKQFSIAYPLSIGRVIYQFDDLKVSHDFYLDRLGHTDNKQFQDFRSDDSHLEFKQLLHDFNFLIDDFFEGECIRLKEFAQHQENTVTKYNKEARSEFNLQFDKVRIEKARQEFSKKNFKKSLEIYKAVEHKNFFNELDKKIIEYAEKREASGPLNAKK